MMSELVRTTIYIYIIYKYIIVVYLAFKQNVQSILAKISSLDSLLSQSKNVKGTENQRDEEMQDDYIVSEKNSEHDAKIC